MKKTTKELKQFIVENLKKVNFKSIYDSDKPELLKEASWSRTYKSKVKKYLETYWTFEYDKLEDFFEESDNSLKWIDETCKNFDDCICRVFEDKLSLDGIIWSIVIVTDPSDQEIVMYDFHADGEYYKLLDTPNKSDNNSPLESSWEFCVIDDEEELEGIGEFPYLVYLTTTKYWKRYQCLQDDFSDKQFDEIRLIKDKCDLSELCEATYEPLSEPSKYTKDEVIDIIESLGANYNSAFEDFIKS